MDWNELIYNKDFLGGYIESREGAFVCAGPLNEIKEGGEDNNLVYFFLPWYIVFDTKTGECENYKASWFFISKDTAEMPKTEHNGSVSFHTSFSGSWTIFPKPN